MASRATSKQSRATRRRYVVVKVEGTTYKVLTVREAKSQQEAMDALVESLPIEQRNGDFGAFLASSFRSRTYTTAQSWSTAKADRPSPFAVEKQTVGTEG